MMNLKHFLCGIMTTIFFVTFLFQFVSNEKMIVENNETREIPEPEQTKIQEPSKFVVKRDIPLIQHRNDIAKVLQDRSDYQIGIEVGVQRGIFSSHVLTNWPNCKAYYLVDVWKHLANYHDIANIQEEQQDLLYHETLTSLKPFANKIIPLRMFSHEAARLIPNGSVDFVYLDARHDYCGVLDDMQMYWPKLRNGGLFAGHDFYYANNSLLLSTGQDWSICADGSKQIGAVKGAVESFSKQHKLQIWSTNEDWPSWYTVKETD